MAGDKLGVDPDLHAAQTDGPGVGDDVGGRGGRVAGDVELGIDVALGEAADDADEEVETPDRRARALGSMGAGSLEGIWGHFSAGGDALYRPHR
jgi:hypothetical protein